MEARRALKRRILNAEPEGYSRKAAAILAELGELVEEQVSASRLARRLSGFDALIVRLGHRVDDSILGADERLVAVVTATTGLDHIDLDAAQRHGVTVLSLRGETAFLDSIYATAEHTWALLLALVRKIPWAFEDVRRGHWRRDLFRGTELRGKRLGILGLGRVGRQIAGFATAFGMPTAAYDLRHDDWPPGVERVETLEELLQRSDVLTIHLPLGNATVNLLDRKRLMLMPRGALLINTSRGGILDETAVAELLHEGHLAGAALDVLAGEQDGRAPAPRLLALAADRLLLTPHLGGATAESMRRTEEFMAEKLERFFRMGAS